MQRRNLTERLVALLPDSEKITVDKAMLAWWKNFRDSGGYRLTADGYAIMAGVLEFEHWRVASPANLKMLVELDKKLTSPYYFDAKKKELILFGSREAMMATLHGDIKRYLELLQVRNN